MQCPLWKGWKLTLGSTAWISSNQGWLSSYCCWMAQPTSNREEDWVSSEKPEVPCHITRHVLQVWICCFSPQNLSQYHHLNAYINVRFTNMGFHIISGNLFYRKGSIRVDPYPQDPLIISCISPPRNYQTETMEQPANGRAEHQFQNNTLQGCRTQKCIICIGSEIFVWHCAPIHTIWV